MDYDEMRARDKAADERLRAKLGTRGFQSNQGGAYECPTCHEWFAGLSYFDAHRPPAASDDPCLDPTSVGLTLDERGRWHNAAKSERLQKVHSGRRAARKTAAEARSV